MDFGLVLPTMTREALAEGIEAAAAAAGQGPWSTVWVTDHLIVGGGPAGNEEYAHIFEALTTLAYVAGRQPNLRLGTSAICVPLRNAVQLAKEIASLDALTHGRLLVAVGLGDADDLEEYANLGQAERFPVRGAYLDEAIRLWRHLWSGSTDPFHGRFHRLENFTFGPLPVQGARLPVWIGGRSAAAARRTGTLGDGFHATRTTPEELRALAAPIHEAAAAAGRPQPALSVRIRLRRDVSSMDDLRAQLRAYADVGVSHVALNLEATRPQEIRAAARRVEDEVLAAFTQPGR